MVVYNVKDYGAKADGITLNSVAVQSAVDDCAKHGGGTVLFENGTFVLGTVFLKSNVYIEIKKDAMILGASSFYDYAPEEKLIILFIKILRILILIVQCSSVEIVTISKFTAKVK